jgi:hypothetical protein
MGVYDVVLPNVASVAFAWPVYPGETNTGTLVGLARNVSGPHIIGLTDPPFTDRDQTNTLDTHADCACDIGCCMARKMCRSTYGKEDLPDWVRPLSLSARSDVVAYRDTQWKLSTHTRLHWRWVWRGTRIWLNTW